MKVYGTINKGSDCLYVSLIDIDKYEGDEPIVFVDLDEGTFPMFTYEDILELLDTWDPYSGKITTVEFGTFNRYGDFTPDDCSENCLSYKKICEYEKGNIKRVTYEKI